MEYTCVFFEKTFPEAEKRLDYLRKTDNYVEVKAYIIPINNEFRVLRKVKLNRNISKKPS